MSGPAFGAALAFAHEGARIELRAALAGALGTDMLTNSTAHYAWLTAPLDGCAHALTGRTVRLAGCVRVWRMLRRFGVSTARVDEAVSRVFDVLVRRLDDVIPGKEQAFLIQVSARVASELRRADARRARVEELAAEQTPEVPSPEQLFEQQVGVGRRDGARSDPLCPVRPRELGLLQPPEQREPPERRHLPSSLRIFTVRGGAPAAPTRTPYAHAHPR